MKEEKLSEFKRLGTQEFGEELSDVHFDHPATRSSWSDPPRKAPHVKSIKSDAENSAANNEQATDGKQSNDVTQQLLPLFTLLMRDPPEGHDFATCPVCKRYGITSLEA